MKEKIYIKDWLALKPYKNNTNVDLYYLKLSNRVLRELTKHHFFPLYSYLNKNNLKVLSCFLTSYFEDLISETNIWNAFVNKHQELYNKKLPFYDTQNYYENEVNVQDLAFLIWYFLNTIQKDVFISPYNDLIDQMAEDIAFVLDEEYEYAPENEKLKSYYELPETDDYYIARNFLHRILNQTYLFYPDTKLKLESDEAEIIKESKDDELLTWNYLKENLDLHVFTAHTRLLSLQSKEWAAEILGKNHPMTKDLLNLSPRVYGLFLYKGQDSKTIFLEHIASNKMFDLKKESFDGYSDLTEIDTLVYIGMVQWKNEWWFSGISFQRPFDADTILDEKASLQSRKIVSFLDHKKDEQTIKEVTQQQHKAFFDYTNGTEIKFLSHKETPTFLEGYFEYYNNSLKLSKREQQKALKRAKKEGLLLNKKEDNRFEIDTDENSALVFFNPISGIEIAFGINSAFPLAENPFFNEAESNQDFLELLLNREHSKELVHYCIKNCKEKLSFFKTEPQKHYEKDLDFILRFFKDAQYHTSHSVTLTGSPDA